MVRSASKKQAAAISLWVSWLVWALEISGDYHSEPWLAIQISRALYLPLHLLQFLSYSPFPVKWWPESTVWCPPDCLMWEALIIQIIVCSPLYYLFLTFFDARLSRWTVREPGKFAMQMRSSLSVSISLVIIGWSAPLIARECGRQAVGEIVFLVVAQPSKWLRGILGPQNLAEWREGVLVPPEVLTFLISTTMVWMIVLLSIRRILFRLHHSIVSRQTRS